jgi:hypothetical protein
LVPKAQATAADAETTYADEIKNPNFSCFREQHAEQKYKLLFSRT